MTQKLPKNRDSYFTSEIISRLSQTKNWSNQKKNMTTKKHKICLPNRKTTKKYIFEKQSGHKEKETKILFSFQIFLCQVELATTMVTAASGGDRGLTSTPGSWKSWSERSSPRITPTCS